MAEERKVIFTLEVDQDKALAGLVQVEKEQERLKKGAKELREEYKKGEITSEEFAQSQVQIQQAQRSLSKEKQELIKQSKVEVGSFNELKQKTAELIKERNSLNITTDKGKQRFQDINKQIKTNTDELKKGEEAGGNFGRSVGDYSKGVGEAAKGLPILGSGINSASSALGGMTKASLAFLATPLGAVLGAIVVVLGSLKAAFTSSEEGENKFAKITAVVSTLVGNFVDLLASLGEIIIDAFENPQEAVESFANLIKENITNRFEGLVELIPQLGKAISLLFKGEFSQAGEVAVNAVTKVATGIDNVTGKLKQASEATKEFINEQLREAELAGKVADMRAKSDIIERKLIIERAKIESDIAELRLKAREEDRFSASERKQFLIEARNLQDNLLTKENEVLVLRRDAITLENTFSRTNKENKKKEAEAIAAVNQKETERLNQARQIQRELNTLSKQEQANQKSKEAAIQKVADEEEKRLMDLAKREEKAFQDLQDFRVQEAIKAQQRITENEELSLEERLRAADEIAKKELELLAQQTAVKLENVQLTEDEITRIQEEEKARRDEIERARVEKKEELANEEAKKDKEKAKIGEDANKEANESILSGTKDLTNNIIALTGENEAIQKGAAIVDVGINLQKEISAINANAAANPANAVTGGGAGAAQSGILTGIAIGKAALGTAAILALAEGGEVTGPSHAGGGVKYFNTGGSFKSPASAIELEGGEGVMKKSAMSSGKRFTVSGTPRQIGSALNMSFGGRSWSGASGGVTPLKFQDGGFFSQQSTSAVNSQADLTNDIIQAQANMPPVFVSVREFNDVGKRVTTKENRASLAG